MVKTEVTNLKTSYERLPWPLQKSGLDNMILIRFFLKSALNQMYFFRIHG